jgi:hypothetical protein
VIAPLSTAVLDQARAREHGLASSLVVLSRTMGMVVALASLTAFGLARFQRIFAERHCDTLQAGGSLRQRLTVFEDCVRGSLLQEYREIFLIAAGLCLIAGLVALVTLPSRAASRTAPRPGARTAAQE